MIELYNRLAILGTVVELEIKIDKPIEFVENTERDYDYVIYNPRKSINRFGLSITSLDGNLKGIPDLDSLPEYNKENNTSYSDKDFFSPTPVYHSEHLKEIVQMFSKSIVRSHILKINPGGYFPAHRDSYTNINVFRIIVPLKNTKPPQFYFILNNNIIHNWNNGSAYFLDTLKEHVLFNASFKPSYWIVFNIDINEDSILTVLSNLKVS